MKWLVLDLISKTSGCLVYCPSETQMFHLHNAMQLSLGLIPGCWQSCSRNISNQRCSTSVCSCASTFVIPCHQVPETRLKNLLKITLHTSRDSRAHAHMLVHIPAHAVTVRSGKRGLYTAYQEAGQPNKHVMPLDKRCCRIHLCFLSPHSSHRCN